ncbi:MAG: hypothetical protein JO317_01715, partial [Verrucomicrobiae bacterium]|nr:hypothetical protein [Verrucomicrobiae bacterium]
MRKGYQILLAVTIAAVVLKLLYDWWNPHELVTFRGKDVAFGEALQAFSKQTRRTILFPANPGTNVDTKVTL